MNTCNQYNERDLLDYLCDRQDGESLTQMQFHLSQCRECREKLGKLREMSDDLSTMHESISNRCLFLRIAVVAAFVLSFSIMGYYYQMSDVKEYPVEIKQPPVHNEQDSVPDSRVDSLKIIITD